MRIPSLWAHGRLFLSGSPSGFSRSSPLSPSSHASATAPLYGNFHDTAPFWPSYFTSFSVSSSSTLPYSVPGCLEHACPPCPSFPCPCCQAVTSSGPGCSPGLIWLKPELWLRPLPVPHLRHPRWKMAPLLISTHLKPVLLDAQHLTRSLPFTDPLQGAPNPPL